MEGRSLDYLIKQSLTTSVDKEELITKKYDEFIKTNNDSQINETLLFFKETSREHIELLKNKLGEIDRIL